MMKRQARRWAPALAVATVLGTAACGSEVPSMTPQPEVPGGNAGADERVSQDVKVTGVELPYPPDGIWEAGSDVDLYMAISNTGTTDVQLVGVSGEDFTDARDGDGPDGVDLTVAPGEVVILGAEGAPRITLVGLDEDLRSSQSIPVTLEFEDAGTVDVEATVSAEEQDPGADVGVRESDAPADATG